jgi:hypothetical protein
MPLTVVKLYVLSMLQTRSAKRGATAVRGMLSKDFPAIVVSSSTPSLCVFLRCVLLLVLCAADAQNELIETLY